MSDSLEPAQDALEVAPSPFALTEDHEFSAPPEVDRVDIYKTIPDAEPVLVESIVVTPPPAHPGTPESDYRRCPCIGVMPGRACPRCNCSKWVKTCPKCKGTMFLQVHSRKGAHARTERCGFCMGLGQVAARLDEVRAAEQVAKAYTAPVTQVRASVQRSPQLPGVRGQKATTFRERAAKKAAGLKRKKAARG